MKSTESLALPLPTNTASSQANSASMSSSGTLVLTLPNVSVLSVAFPLPTYSDRVMSSIRNGSVIAEIDRMVEETAYHILKHGDILNRTDYDTFGRRLHDAYPCIAFRGSEPWV